MLTFGTLAVHVHGYSDLVVFGDSLSDVGNVFDNTLGFAAADPYVDGRLTNGGNYVDHLAPLLGLPAPVHSGDGGSNYAHGGAQIRLGASAFIDPLTVQKDDYLAASSGVADPEALYIVYGGGNDMRDTSVNIATAANDLVSIVEDLLDAGATSIVVPNLPDLGVTPEVTEFGQGAGNASTARTLQFNAAVDSGLEQLNADDRIVRFDVFGQLNAIIDDSAVGGPQFGFTNVVDDCWEGGPGNLGLGDPFFGAPAAQCSQPDNYLFWDVLHPTTAAHELLAEQLYDRLSADVAAGDFNSDGSWDCQDIDGLVATIAAGNTSTDFDVNGDGVVDLADVDEWRAVAGEINLGAGQSYLIGDADLDGVVDTSDFNIWNQNKFTATAAWCHADFNADGVTDTTDFNQWNENKFLSSDATATVPEPQLAVWCLIVFAFAASRRRSGR